ncbi:phenylalanine--tRNA ligase subunit alpha [Patescibacteria group bacterium]|nr:MAG: phenylalanine--tRNA ligase subunit alpha [Patescibacteria group bacterium]
MQTQFDKLKSDALAALKKAADRDALEALRVELLGRKGKMAELMKRMAGLADEERKLAGKTANEVKQAMEAAFAAAEKRVLSSEAGAMAEKEWIDVTEPGVAPHEGHLHPVSTAIAQVTDIFSRIGFTRVRAPEIDWDWYAFESLNMPKDHPARDDWETFFIAPTSAQCSEGRLGRIVLTPHTSNSQVREIEKGKLPIRMININRTYRRQSDVTHVPMFHQFEGLMIGEGLSVAHLKGVLDHFARNFFGEGRSIRLRPHHFRFTEPSFEVDISCDNCGGKENVACRLCKTGWLELGGAGMVHPNVLKAGGLDPEKVTGFAFGWGVERTLMMREGIKIDDIRILYRNDLRFVQQF